MVNEDLSQGKTVQVKMKTQILQNGEIYNHLTEEMGRLVELNGHYYIRYEEAAKDENYSVTVKITKDGEVHLIRQGKPATRMNFSLNKATEFSYHTPAGMMAMQVDTSRLEFSLKNQPFAGEVFIDYQINTPHQKIGDYKLHLRFTT